MGFETLVTAFYALLEAFGYTHPVHPILVHVTIGLVVASLLFGLLSLWPQYAKYANTARHCITLAFFSAIPTILLGLVDWVHYFGGSWSPLFKIKIVLGVTLATLLGIATLLHGWFGIRSLVVQLTYFAAFVVVVLLGYYGGELVHASATPHHASIDEPSERDGEPLAGVSYAQVDRIMRRDCVHCHSRHNRLGGLDLSSHEALMRGGDSGTAVKPGEPGKSLLVQMLKGEAEPLMPLGGPPLAKPDIERIATWVEEGASAE
ncbi:hypothetical protein CKO15_03190 [Halorhodospira abdelmalekii]|uniref:c-type cytochrome domain-containing protein n=1 Tax=Halorhodospira abdelmalekii TaxID=421629 RepID=UPI001907676D|nr:c-type cytochrome domain-containing protein [Halorhodospira abdelmalekii]MBK1734303.1 hypothetical protein [Halorhodospira abdelmalekii]